MGNETSHHSSDICRIILLGDSVFDDFCWDDSHETSLKNDIIKEFGGKVSIYNLALQEMQIHDMLHGIQPAKHILQERKKYGFPDYVLNDHGFLYPLKVLAHCRKEKQYKHSFKDCTIRPTVLLSLGLFDIGEKIELGKPILITEGLKQEEFEESYESIIKHVLELDFNLILVIPYEPHEGLFEDMVLFSREDLLAVYEWSWMRVMKLAERYGLPVIDLSRTFNPYDKTDYGANPLVPSKKSSRYIIDLISHIFTQFDFQSYQESHKKFRDSVTYKNMSKIYFGKKQGNCTIGCEINNKKYREEYIHMLDKKMPAIEEPGDLGLLADLFGEEPELNFDEENKEEEKAEDLPFGMAGMPPRERSRGMVVTTEEAKDAPHSGSTSGYHRDRR